MIRFFLIINKSCQTRYSKYYQDTIIKDVNTFELEFGKLDTVFQVERVQNWVYASLYFIIGCDLEENDFSVLELIQLCVETLNRMFEKVTELDLVFNLEKVHMIMDELVTNGLVLETNQDRLSASQCAPYLI